MVLYIRLIAAIAAAYLYTFAIGKLKGLPPLKWLPDNFVTGLIYNVIGIIIFVSILVWPYYKEMKTRTAELKKIAAKMGFVFHDGEYHPEQSLLQSPLLRRGYRSSFSQAITGKYYGAETLVFDHVYSKPGRSGKEDERYSRTVTVFHTPELHIPEFIMVKRSLGDRMFDSLFGSEHVNFKSDTEFSKHYMLNGPDQDSVKNLFTSKLRSAFTGSEKRWAASGVNNNLILFTDSEFDEELKPAEFVAYLEKTWEIFSIIKSKIKQKTE